MSAFKVYIETGKKKVFATAADWPGWSRSGKDEDQALQNLLDYGTRYASLLNNGGILFSSPNQISSFIISERLPGNSTTDFGAPAAIPAADQRPFKSADFEFSARLLQACWSAFDKAVQAAACRQLRKGPRGGGRDVNKITSHILDAERGYLARIAWQHKAEKDTTTAELFNNLRQATLEALNLAASEGLPERGPRGGKIWPARYFVRRSAWHILDHGWEIEDRIM